MIDADAGAACCSAKAASGGRGLGSVGFGGGKRGEGGEGVFGFCGVFGALLGFCEVCLVFGRAFCVYSPVFEVFEVCLKGIVLLKVLFKSFVV